jgi:hypothetical protein
MKIVFAFLLLSFSGISVGWAQDIITLTTGQEINGRILRLNKDDLKYVPKDMTDTLSMLRAGIQKIHYQNGTIVILAEDSKLSAEPEAQTDSMFYIGAADASRFYQGYHGASTGTLVAAIVFPLNLIPAIACSATPPSDANLDFPNPRLMENQNYRYGYEKQAFAIKKKKVWTNFAIGSGAFLAFYILLTAVSVSSY